MPSGVVLVPPGSRERSGRNAEAAARPSAPEMPRREEGPGAPAGALSGEVSTASFLGVGEKFQAAAKGAAGGASTNNDTEVTPFGDQGSFPGKRATTPGGGRKKLRAGSRNLGTHFTP